MIVLLFEPAISPGAEAFRYVHRLIVSERLSTDEPGALRHIDQCQQGRKKPPHPRSRKNLRCEGRGCRLKIFRPGHSGPAAFAGFHFTSACGKVPLATGRLGTAAPGGSAERRSAKTWLTAKIGRASLDWTAEGGCPHAVRGGLHTARLSGSIPL